MCLTVDAFPIQYHFAYLHYLQNVHKKYSSNFTKHLSLALMLLSRSCHRPGVAEDPYHTSFSLPREFINLNHVVTVDVFTGEQEAMVLSPVTRTPPHKQPLLSSLYARTSCLLLRPQV